MVTINDIAKLAGVSRTTVSRFLNESGYVGEEAKQKIKQVIDDTGYRPSEQAKSLRLKRTKVIGVVIPKISTETASRIVEGMDEVLSAEGYQILLANSGLNKDKEKEQLKLLESRRVDGIILIATNRKPDLIQTVDQLQVPFVAVGQDLPGSASVIYDDYHAAKMLVTRMIEKGYRRIAFIGIDESDEAVGVQRKQAYLDIMKERNLPTEEAWLQTASFSTEAGEASMEKILAECEQQPEAVFAVTDRLAVGALQTIRKHGIKVPEEMGLAGIGASEMARYVTPALTTVDYQYEEAGKVSAKLLLEEIVSGTKKVEKTRLSYRLLERDSLS